jgi:hypothetical protein
MLMHVNAKKLAFLGLLLSLAVILVVLSGILEFNTLFLLAAASYFVGIAISETGLRAGFGFYISSVLLTLILAPNKFYCITFSTLGLYMVIAEYAFEKLTHVKYNIKQKKMILWLIKYAAFNIMFIPVLMLFPKLIYQGQLSHWLLAVLILAGQIFLLFYDKAYHYFENNIWNKIHGYFHF